MNILDRVSISRKIPIVLALITAIAIAVTSMMAAREARRGLLDEGKLRLDSIAASRGDSIAAWFDHIRTDLVAQAEAEWLARAMTDFSKGWKALGESAPDSLTRLYIDDNPNPAGKKHLLRAAEDASLYSAIHRKLHPDFVSIFEKKGYYDIFLVDPEGNIVYTVFKESDYATNLATGPWKDTGLATAWQAARDLQRGESAAVDFTSYGPSAGAPALFMATPIVLADNRSVGTLVYQLPTDGLRAILDEPTGLGATGETYLVGADFQLRSDLRLSDSPTALALRAETQAAQRAIAGEVGVVEAAGRNGQDAVMAYRPLEVDSLRFAVIAEQDRGEVLAAAVTMTRLMAGLGLGIILAAGALALLFARSLARPILRLSESIAHIAGRNYEVAVPEQGRGDELGLISRGLESFRGSLAQAAEAERENAFRGAALENASSALMIMNAEFVVTYANPAVMELLRTNADKFRTKVPGFDPDRVIGQSMDSFHVLPDRVRGLIENPANLPYAADITVDGERFALTVSDIPDAFGGRIGFVLEWKNVTAERMNAAILGALDRNQCKAVFDLDGRVIDANENFASLFGFDNRTQGTQTRMNLFPRLAGDKYWRELGLGETVFDRFQMQGQRPVVLDGSLSPVFDRSGRTVQIVLLGVDVTEAEASLRAAEAQRQQMTAAQEEVVGALSVSLDRLSNGDLVCQIDEPFANEYEQLRANFNSAVRKLSTAIGDVVTNAASITSDAEQISAAADDLGRRTEHQAATLEETAAALDELTTSVASAADAAANANLIASRTREAAERSGGIMQDAKVAMSQIASSSEQIGRITGVIDEIAFQTNLLALNAGVEAARAGEAGRGFAVVASEVRALAQRASEAAKEISTLIDGSVRYVTQGVTLVNAVGSSLGEIVDAVGDVSSKMSEIAASAQEQSAGLREINGAVNQLDQATQQNAAMFEEATAASQALTRGAQSLQATTALFRVQAAERAHDRAGVSPDRNAA